MYPRNGTYEWATGTNIVSYSNGRRDYVDSVILICVYTIIAGVSVAIALAFSTCYCT